MSYLNRTVNVEGYDVWGVMDLVATRLGFVKSERRIHRLNDSEGILGVPSDAVGVWHQDTVRDFLDYEKMHPDLIVRNVGANLFLVNYNGRVNLSLLDELG